MKVNIINSNNLYPKSHKSMCCADKRKESARERENKTENKQYQMNTTIKMNSDGRVNFKGGVPLLHRAANFASYNPLVAEALFALVVTCGLRPLTIMATAKNDEDKEKCSYQAAKSISSGLVGLATTALVGTPIAAATKLANKNGAFNMPIEMKEHALAVVKEGVEALRGISGSNSLNNQIKLLTEGGKINLSVFKKSAKGAEAQFKNTIKEKAPEIYEKVCNAITEQKVLDNYAKTGKNVADKFLQPIFMPVRATITIALVPILLGLIGKSKPSKPKENINNPYQTMNINVFRNQNEKLLFQPFAEVTNYENK